MKKLVFPIILSLLIFLITAPAISETRGIKVIKDLSHRSGKLGAYRALIIGINDYKDPKIPDLETAVKDAKAMAELLQERYGFKVNLLLNQNATREVIYRALRKLAISTKSDDSVLILTGHMTTVGGSRQTPRAGIRSHTLTIFRFKNRCAV